jgi:hypothetical protein
MPDEQIDPTHGDPLRWTTPADYDEPEDCNCPDADRKVPRQDRTTWNWHDEWLSKRAPVTITLCPLCQPKTTEARERRKVAWEKRHGYGRDRS